MKDIIIGVLLLFTSSTCIHYWIQCRSEDRKEDAELERKWWSCD